MTTAQRIAKIEKSVDWVLALESSFERLIIAVDALDKRVTRLEFKMSDHITADRYRQQEQEQETHNEAE